MKLPAQGSCQKRTGSAFSMGVVAALDSLDIDGELTACQRVSDDGNANTRFSCAGCGNIIYGTGDTNPDLAKLRSGLLEDTSDVAPGVHMWVCRKQPWVVLPPGVPTFDTRPEDGLALLQAALDYRASRN